MRRQPHKKQFFFRSYISKNVNNKALFTGSLFKTKKQLKFLSKLPMSNHRNLHIFSLNIILPCLSKQNNNPFYRFRELEKVTIFRVKLKYNHTDGSGAWWNIK